MANHDAKQEICDVEDCDKPAERSLNRKQIVKTSFSLKDSRVRQVHLCKKHYKVYKKESKTDRELDSYY